MNRFKPVSTPSFKYVEPAPSPRLMFAGTCLIRGTSFVFAIFTEIISVLSPALLKDLTAVDRVSMVIAFTTILPPRFSSFEHLLIILSMSLPPPPIKTVSGAGSPFSPSGAVLCTISRFFTLNFALFFSI